MRQSKLVMAAQYHTGCPDGQAHSNLNAWHKPVPHQALVSQVLGWAAERRSRSATRQQSDAEVKRSLEAQQEMV